MKKFLLSVVLIAILSSVMVYAQKAPLAYVLPAKDKVIVVLGDTPRSVEAFNVYRKDPGARDFKLLNKEPVTRVKDPYKAIELMGSDFKWISKRLGSEDPDFVYNRLSIDRNTMLALCLVSHGLRLAMGRTYIDSKVEKGKTYRYRIVLLNILGREVKRIEKSVKVGDAPKPDKPSELKAVAGDGNVKLSWKYPSYRGGERDLTVGFILYRKEAEGKYVRLNSAPVLRIEGWLSYIDENVKNGVFYTYALEAMNMIGIKSERIYSESVKPIDKKPPLVPMGLRAVDSEKGVLLVWKISPEMDADHYNVYRGESLKGDFKKINTQPLPVSSPRFVDSKVVRGVVHYYRVTAVDKSGNESPMSGPASIIPKDTEPPSPVKGITAKVDVEKRFVTLSWKSLDAPDLKGYYVYRGESKDKMLRINKDPLKQSEKPAFLDTGYKKKGLRPGRMFWYAVTGVDNSNNEGKRTYIEVMMPDKVPPPPPFYLTAKPTNDGNVRLTWQPCLSRDLDKHFVYRYEGKDFIKVKELDKKVTEWIDKTVERGKEYRYRVTEVDTSGNESKPSREVKVIPTDIVPPKAPVNLKATVEKWGIRLKWEAPPDKDIKGYLVYSIPPGGERWKLLTRKPTEKLEYFNMWAKPGTTYGVSAIDTSGNESRKAVVKTSKESSGGEKKKEKTGGAKK